MHRTSEHIIAFEIEGAGAVVTVSDRAMLGRVAGVAPWGAKQRPPAPGDRRFELNIAGDGRYAVLEEGEVRNVAETLEVALIALANYLLVHVLLRARDVLFVHAGVVESEGRGIVLPGASGIGKSTLVGALITAGARYYTDDYMALDGSGRVQPLSMPLWLNDPETGRGISRTPESFGGQTGADQIPVGMIVHLPFRDGAELRLQPQTAAAGVMLVLGNAYGAELRPQLALAVARAAVANACIFEGERGDAEEAATVLLEFAAEQRRRAP